MTTSELERIESWGWAVIRFPDGHFEAKMGNAWISGLIETENEESK